MLCTPGNFINDLQSVVDGLLIDRQGNVGRNGFPELLKAFRLERWVDEPDKFIESARHELKAHLVVGDAFTQFFNERS